MNVTITCCVPRQLNDRTTKLAWLEEAVTRTKPGLFLTPQEFFGGHVAMPNDLHIEKEWLVREIGSLAKRTGVAIGVGAAVKHSTGGATEDYIYFGPDGTERGHHRKFALPSYDDVRAKGAGQLWPEVNYSARVRPVEIRELALKIGTVFCWEVFSLTMFPAYSLAGVNLIAHPIKFAPRGWPKNAQKDDGQRHVESFGVENKGRDLWREKLIFASSQECFCPIAISCNTWNIGPKFMALTGHVDELLGKTDLVEVPAVAESEHLHTFTINPAVYSGMDHHFSAAEFKEHVGDLETFHDLDPWTMHTKVRRLEAQLIGGTTRLDCLLKASGQRRQKPSTFKRAGKLGQALTSK